MAAIRRRNVFPSRILRSGAFLWRRPNGIRPSAALRIAAIRILALVFACFSVLPSVSPPALGNLSSPPPGYREAEARMALSRLTLPEKASQVLMVSIPGNGSLPEFSARILRTLRPGGILLFGFNVPDDPLELGGFVDTVQDTGSVSGVPLAVAIDHEGGVVFRFGETLTRVPSAEEVGRHPPGYARTLGLVSASELRAIGVNMVLAPVVETKNGTNAAFLGSRSYGGDPRTVDRRAGAFIDGLQSWSQGNRGVAATAKHFPGNSAEDPHRGPGTLDISLSAYEKDIAPRFAGAASHGVAAVMLSHVRFPAVTGDDPSSISPAAIRRLLKGELGFRGVALTDDLYMGALAKIMPPEESAVRALAAGADFIMLSSAASGRSVRDAILEALRSGALARSRIDDAAFRILAMKYRFSMDSGLDRALRASARHEFGLKIKKNREKISIMESIQQKLPIY